MRPLLLGGALAVCASVCSAEVVVANAAFEDLAGPRPVDWNCDTAVIRAEKGAGHNGSGGLVWESATPAPQRGATQVLTGWKTGEAYRFQAEVRTVDFKGRGAVVCLEWYDAKGKWIAGAYSPSMKDANCDWTVVEGVTPKIPETAVRLVLQLYVQRDCTGRVCWDNVNVTPLVRPAVEWATTTVYRNTAATGRVTFLASVNVPAEAPDAVAEFRWTDASGAPVRRTATIREGVVRLPVEAGELAPGEQRVTCALVAEGRDLGSADFVFVRSETEPARRVSIDRYGRCLVNGQPFFPLGMYLSGVERPVLERFVQAPFNCVMPYRRIDRAGLDLCQEFGLMAFCSIKDVYLGGSSARALKYTEQAQVDAWLREQVGAVKDHPALLGWYLNDEAPATRIPQLRHHYELVRAADAEHPCWTVLDRLHDLRQFVGTFDVLGVDPYPVGKFPLRHITDFTRGTRRETLDLVPLWNVPQTFDWAWYFKGDSTAFRYPTLAEIKSMNWQHIACGANGLISYAFHCYWQKDRVDRFDDYFGPVVEATKEVKKMESVLLSVEPTPAVTPSTDDLVARAWTKDGDLYVLVCNTRDKPVEASVAIAEGAWELKSVEVGETSVAAEGAVLKVSLPAIAQTFVRLTRQTVPVHSLLKEGHRRFYAVPRAERVEKFLDQDFRHNLSWNVRGQPAGVPLAWTDGTAPYRVTLTKGGVADGAWTSPTNGLVLTNLEIARTYAWTATDATGRTVGGGIFATADEAPRFLAVGGMNNIRDLGGRRGRDGRRVRQGLVLRSEGFNYNASRKVTTNELGVVATNFVPSAKNRVTADGAAYLTRTLGLKTDLDLRSDPEVYGMTGSPLGDGVRWIRFSSGNYGEMKGKTSRKAFVNAFRLFLDPANYPIGFHCIAGADRTGSLACILNGLLGVDEEELLRDWETTAFNTDYLKFAHKERWDALVAVFNAYPGATLNDRIEAYVLDCGITREEIETFRGLMLE